MMFAVTTSFAMLSLSACGDDDDAPDGGMTNAGRAAVAVDLGLPSCAKWADRNVGASSKTDVGEYFAWGEIATKSDFLGILISMVKPAILNSRNTAPIQNMVKMVLRTTNPN